MGLISSHTACAVTATIVAHMISFYRLEGEKLSPAAQAVVHLKHFNDRLADEVFKGPPFGDPGGID
jgi:hypothetical protein